MKSIRKSIKILVVVSLTCIYKYQIETRINIKMLNVCIGHPFLDE
jgi:hypothetical protein